MTTETTTTPTVEATTFSLEYVKELRAENKSYRLKANDFEKSASEALSKAEQAQKSVAELETKYKAETESRVQEISNQANQRIIRSELK